MIPRDEADGGHGKVQGPGVADHGLLQGSTSLDQHWSHFLASSSGKCELALLGTSEWFPIQQASTVPTSYASSPSVSVTLFLTLS